MRSTEPSPAASPGGSDAEFSHLIELWLAGDGEARDRLISLMYPDLRRIAARRMRFERVDHTLQPTALVNEFFLHLAQRQATTLRSRTHFLALASQMMKRMLVDHARSRGADKRAGNRIHLQLDELSLPSLDGGVDLVEIGELLDQLSHEEPRMAEVFDMRCFGGLTHAEIAEVIGVDERTVKRDWQVARAWVVGHMRRGD